MVRQTHSQARAYCERPECLWVGPLRDDAVDAYEDGIEHHGVHVANDLKGEREWLNPMS